MSLGMLGAITMYMYTSYVYIYIVHVYKSWPRGVYVYIHLLVRSTCIFVIFPESRMLEVNKHIPNISICQSAMVYVICSYALLTFDEVYIQEYKTCRYHGNTVIIRFRTQCA